MVRYLLALLVGAGTMLGVAGARPAAAQSLAVPIPAVSDPLLQNLSIPATAPTQGMWSAVQNWPVVALHASMLPDGQILSYGTPTGSPGGSTVQDGRTFDRWNPLNPGTHTQFANSQNVDSFCSAGVLQSDGTLLISGGDSNASPGNLSRNGTVFNPSNNNLTTLTSTMASDRWYASMIVLADGRSMITGGGVPYVTEAYANPAGNLNNVSMTPEVFTPGQGWSSLFGANSRDAFGPDFNRWWYPRNWVAPNGQVFGISTEKMWYLNPAGNGSITTVGTFKGGVSDTNKFNVGPTSTAVMYDVGRILQVGGNGYTNGFNSLSSQQATTFDIRNGNPVVTETAQMAFPRQWANSTVVPTGKVIVSGGTRHADDGNPQAVFAAESWDPASGTWSTLSSAGIVRNYHSAITLLQNGVLLSTGGGVPGPVTNFNAEYFYPPYLFKSNGQGGAILADIPRLLSISASQLTYGGNFQVEIADTRTISRVVLIGLSTTTHSFNMGQRYIPLTFTQAGQILTATSPAGGSVAPPGYYQVFVVDSAGVPSRGFIVKYPMPPLPTPGDVAIYPMNQQSGTLVPDTSGNNKNGTLSGSPLPTWVAARSVAAGNGVRIPGGAGGTTTPYVDLPDGLVSGCADFTFAAWVNLAANPNWNRIFDFGSNTTTNMFLTTAAGGAILRFAITTAGGGMEQRISFNTTFPLNAWRHVAVTLSGNTGRLYLAGAQVASNTNLALNPNNLGNTVNNWLGRSQYGADPRMNGVLDDVRISCRAYSASEIATLATP